MGTEIDRLEIQVGAQAQKTNSQLETLITKLDSVASSLMRIDGSGLIGMANGVQKVGAVTNSVGLIGETSINTSMALAMLSADLSSLTNQDLSSVMSSLQSGLLGQSRALYEFGIDITNNTLQQYAYAEGIDKSVSAMNQAEKMQLRLLAILDQSKVAWGDQANTLGSAANQYRIMQQQAGNLARTIGNLFLPVMKVTLPYVNALLIVTQRLLQTFGFKMWGDSWLKDLQDGISGGVIDDSGLEELEEDFDGVADAAKKAKGSVRAFDELNVITTQDKGSTSTGGIGGIDLSGSISDALAAYEKTWEEAFAEAENKAQEWADKIEKILEPIKKIFKDFAVGDFFQVGKDVSALVVSITDFFARAIDNVNWYGIGQKIGDSLRGIDWLAILKSVGNPIWQALKAAFELYVGASDSAPSGTTLTSFISMPGLLKKITENEIIKGVGNLGSGFSDIAAAFKKGGINGALETFRGKLSGTQKFSIGALGVAEEYALVKSGFKDIETGSDNLITSLGKIAGGAGLAVGALKLIGLSNPWTALIVGATGLAGAIMGIKEAQKEALEELDREQELRVFGESVDSLTASWRDSAQAIRDRVEASREYVETSGTAEAQMARDLADRYFELAEKTSLTNEEKDEMIRLSDLLVEKIPELEQYYNSETGLIDTTRESVEKLIDTRLREIQLNAMEEELTQLYKERIDKMKNLEQAAEKIYSSQNEFQNLSDAYKEQKNLLDLLYEYNGMQDQIIQSLKTPLEQYSYANDSIMGLSEETQKLIERQKELKDTLGSAGIDVSNGYDKIMQEMHNICTQIELLEENNIEVYADFVGYEESFQELEGRISELKTMWSEAAISETGAAGYVQQVNEYISGAVKIVEEKGGVTGYSLIRELESGAEDAIEENNISKIIESLAGDAIDGAVKGIEFGQEAINTAVRNIVGKGLETWQDEQESNSPSKVTEGFGNDAVDGYILGIGEKTGETLYTVSDLVSQAIGKASEIITPMHDIGVNAMQGLHDGISSMARIIHDKVAEIANNIEGTVREVLEIHSPSRAMFELGDYTMQGFQLGLENVQQTILRSMEDFSYEIVTTSTPSIPELYGNQSYVASYIAKSGDSDFGQSSFGQDSAETNRLLRQILAAVQEGHTITIGRDDVGRASVDFIQENERRLQRSIVGTF